VLHWGYGNHKRLPQKSLHHQTSQSASGNVCSILRILPGHTNLRVFLPLTISPSDSIPPPFGNIHTEPDDQTRSKAKSKEEREPLPIISGAIDDGLDDVRANHAGSPVREAKQAEKLEVRKHAGHLCGVIGVCGTRLPCCRNREDSVQPSSSGRRRSRKLGTAQIRRYTPCMTMYVRECIPGTQSHTNVQNSQALWKPNLRVHKPIIPQRGIKTVTTFVTTNWNCLGESRVSIDIRSRRCNSPSSLWGFSSTFGCTRS
jgi:hypothetical protein